MDSEDAEIALTVFDEEVVYDPVADTSDVAVFQDPPAAEVCTAFELDDWTIGALAGTEVELVPALAVTVELTTLVTVDVVWYVVADVVPLTVTTVETGQMVV